MNADNYENLSKTVNISFYWIYGQAKYHDNLYKVGGYAGPAETMVYAAKMFIF